MPLNLVMHPKPPSGCRSETSESKLTRTGEPPPFPKHFVVGELPRLWDGDYGLDAQESGGRIAQEKRPREK